MIQNLQIAKGDLSRFSNAAHCAFHTQAIEILTKSDVPPSVLMIPQHILEEWKQVVDCLPRVLKTKRASLHTQFAADEEVKRDKILVHLFRMIRAAAATPIPSHKQAAQALMLLVKPGQHRLSTTKETAFIRGLVENLRSPKWASHVATLGLAPLVDNLAQANEAYAGHIYSRIDEATHRPPSARALRPVADALYGQVIIVMRAAYLLTPSAQARAQMAHVAERLNMAWADMLARHRRSQALRRGHTEQGE